MNTEGIGLLAAIDYLLPKDKSGLNVTIIANPGPFPQGLPPSVSTVQYVGITKHLVLALLDRKWMESGLIGFSADMPYDLMGEQIKWVGAVECLPCRSRSFKYELPDIFIRSAEAIIGDTGDLVLPGLLSSINGVITGNQYYFIEIPALTREVLLQIDEVVIMRRRKKTRAHWYRPLVINRFGDIKAYVNRYKARTYKTRG